MKLSYSQLMQTPWGYSNQGSYRTYKARYSPESANKLNKEIGNAQLTHLFPTKSGKVILTITAPSASPVWRIVEEFTPTKPAKQLLLNLRP